MDNDEQIEEHKVFFYNFIFDGKNDCKESKKNDVKVKYNFEFVMLFCKEIIRVFLQITPMTPILQNRIIFHLLGEFLCPK